MRLPDAHSLAGKVIETLMMASRRATGFRHKPCPCRRPQAGVSAAARVSCSSPRTASKPGCARPATQAHPATGLQNGRRPDHCSWGSIFLRKSFQLIQQIMGLARRHIVRRDGRQSRAQHIRHLRLWRWPRGRAEQRQVCQKVRRVPASLCFSSWVRTSCALAMTRREVPPAARG